jgi:hypothetical protein
MDQSGRALLALLTDRAITTYIDATNADPKPFRWTKSANDILASIQRFCLRTLATCA